LAPLGLLVLLLFPSLPWVACGSPLALLACSAPVAAPRVHPGNDGEPLLAPRIGSSSSAVTRRSPGVHRRNPLLRLAGLSGRLVGGGEGYRRAWPAAERRLLSSRATARSKPSTIPGSGIRRRRRHAARRRRAHGHRFGDAAGSPYANHGTHRPRPREGAQRRRAVRSGASTSNTPLQFRGLCAKRTTREHCCPCR
jgi:hypothetical protein